MLFEEFDKLSYRNEKPKKRMCVLKISDFDERSQILDALLGDYCVFTNLSAMEAYEKQRILDYLLGVCEALGVIETMVAEDIYCYASYDIANVISENDTGDT